MGSAVSSTTRVDLDREGRRGHSYSKITVTGNARAHNGDVYNISNFYGAWPDALSTQRQQGAACNPVRTLGKRKRSVRDFGDEPSRGGNPSLTLAISQLGEFSTSLRHQKQGQAAQRVVSWIRVILDAFEASGTPSQQEHSGNELAMMQNGLFLTNRVEINSVSGRKIPDQVVRVRRKSSLIIFEHWKIALDTTSWEALDEYGREVTGSFSVLRLEPLNLASVSPMAAFFGERTDYYQTSTIHPTVFAYRGVSGKSEVFKFVTSDDIHGLMKLLAEQKATTRDLDEHGRSLLHYACAYHSPICCRFLIESGADVDRLASTFGHSETTGTPLSFDVSEPGQLPRCIALLLDAGADPTIPLKNRKIAGFYSPLFRTLREAIERPPASSSRRSHSEQPDHKLKRMVTGYFFDPTVATRGTPESSIWLSAFLGHHRPSPEIVKNLLDAGCDVNETAIEFPDIPKDWNCLFLLVSKATMPEDSRDFEILRLLLRRGANMSAKDASGMTVSDWVNRPYSTKEYSPLRQYQRALWYCALRREGIHLSPFDEMRPLATTYEINNTTYTLEHYYAMCYLDAWTKGDLFQQIFESVKAQPETEETILELARLRHARSRQQQRRRIERNMYRQIGADKRF